jgi:hypothetical protein
MGFHATDDSHCGVGLRHQVVRGDCQRYRGNAYVSNTYSLTGCNNQEVHNLRVLWGFFEI